METGNLKISLLLLMVGLAGGWTGFSLPVSESGAGAASETGMHCENQLAFAQRPVTEASPAKVLVMNDPESIRRGRDLFDAKCKFCHHVNSTETIVGPGLKGILKNKKLPVSKAPATPGDIFRQLKEPFNRMPSFAYLTDEEMSDIIAFLNTL